MKEEFVNYLFEKLDNNEKLKINNILNNRTNYLTVVLEDVYQTQNTSSVIRTCDNLGIQNIHVIEKRNKFNIDTRISKGSEKLVNINKYNNENNKDVFECINILKAQGYRIIATTPHKNDNTIYNLPLNGKMAFLFGTEENGLTKEAINLSEEFVKIPMFGFTESLNISVCLSLLLFEIKNRLIKEKVTLNLECEEALDLKLKWCKNQLHNFNLLKSEYNNKL